MRLRDDPAVRAWYERSKFSIAMMVLAFVMVGFMAGLSAMDGDWLMFTVALALIFLFWAIDTYMVITGIRTERHLQEVESRVQSYLAGTLPPDEFPR